MISSLNMATLRRRFSTICVALFVAAAAFVQFLEIAPVSSLRYAFFDVAQRVLPTLQPSAPITLVEVDDASIRAFGQWPWPRDRVAEAMSMLARHKPAAIGLDIIFSEPDRLSPEIFSPAMRFRPSFASSWLSCRRTIKPWRIACNWHQPFWRRRPPFRRTHQDHPPRRERR